MPQSAMESCFQPQRKTSDVLVPNPQQWRPRSSDARSLARAATVAAAFAASAAIALEAAACIPPAAADLLHAARLASPRSPPGLGRQLARRGAGQPAQHRGMKDEPSASAALAAFDAQRSAAPSSPASLVSLAALCLCRVAKLRGTLSHDAAHGTVLTDVIMLLRCSAEEDELDSQTLSDVMVAVARLGPRKHRLLPALLESCAKSFARICWSSAQPLHIANGAWAMAKSGSSVQGALDAIARKSAECMESFTALDLARLAWSWATLLAAGPEQAPEGLMARLWAAAVAKQSEFTAQSMANLAWSFAKLSGAGGALHSPLLSALSAQSRRKLEEFDPQGLSSLVWAVATCTHRDEELFLGVGLRASASTSAFTCQGLANIAWAFAKASVFCQTLLDAVAALPPCLGKPLLHVCPCGIFSPASQSLGIDHSCTPPQYGWCWRGLLSACRNLYCIGND
ncbi:unnamed protein product [Polarella glacialis]|uniref:RAP domain-containing protein n=1 Tax=Polarella glacialis TaxID=89957 RepID=A0A813LNU4_POLGL|nr:unnamed protein product [Polarella glacialis]